jgi:arylsulfate sulfotransferase
VRYFDKLGLLVALAGVGVPLHATVSILSLIPSYNSPQPLGTPITWTTIATDSAPNQLTFQFSVAAPGQKFFVKQDFNAGTNSGENWTSQPYTWTTIQAEGVYQIRVIAKDFSSGETNTKMAYFALTSRVTGSSAVINSTANSLVALFSAPACASGSQMRVAFETQGQKTASLTDWKTCNGKTSMNFYIAGMYPQTNYQMNYQVLTGTSVTHGPAPLSFMTGAKPVNLTFPAFTVTVPAGPQTDTAQTLLIHSLTSLNSSEPYFPLATDLSGHVMWYYGNPTDSPLLTRPLPNEAMLTIQDGPAWQSLNTKQQMIRVIDLAGNIQLETNTGIIQYQLINGSPALTLPPTPDAGPCTAIQQPAQVGDACLGSFHHDVIALNNGDFVAIADIEKIFPAGTQEDTSGLPVDIMGDMLIVLNPNLQVIWYWEAFQHDGGGTQLDINRAAVLGETCTSGQTGCPPIFLLGPGIAPAAHDWMHSNSIYYWPQNGDLILSMRHQDWVIKIDYQNGAPTATGNVLWRMGLDGDFTFNTSNDPSEPYPWFSHQHDVGMENQGAGPLSLFDNGNTRIATLGSNCGPADCNSRGMALTVDETNLMVTPVISQDLGVYSLALGAAQLLSNLNWFFQPGLVVMGKSQLSYCQELLPTAGTTNGTIIDSLQGVTSYRSFRQADTYHPPAP